MIQIKVLVIEDEIVIANNIRQILEKNNFHVTGVSSDFEKACKLYQQERPDIILSDIYLNESRSGIDAILEMNSKYGYDVPVIIISAYSDERTLNEACRINPVSYITKPFTPEQVITALSVAVKSLQLNEPLDVPTHRELEIINLLATGLASKQVAEKLSISFHTVESHRKNLLRKYNVNSTAELVFMAASRKWIHS